MKRRTVLFAGLAAGGLATGAGAVFRLHQTSNRAPKMTDAHLNAVAGLKGRGPRVLFVGNSMTLRHDLPDRVLQMAAADGHDLTIATAAARGMRLVEALRISAFRKALQSGWDALVLQEFSTTALRATDRLGSRFAMAQMARMAEAKAVVLFPPWAFPPSHPVYQSGGGALSAVPSDPAEYADEITAFHDGLARAKGWVRAPVTEAFLPDATPWLDDDKHHPNVQGTDRAAGVIWQTLRDQLVDLSLPS